MFACVPQGGIESILLVDVIRPRHPYDGAGVARRLALQLASSEKGALCCDRCEVPEVEIVIEMHLLVDAQHHGSVASLGDLHHGITHDLGELVDEHGVRSRGLRPQTYGEPRRTRVDLPARSVAVVEGHHGTAGVICPFCCQFDLGSIAGQHFSDAAHDVLDATLIRPLQSVVRFHDLNSRYKTKVLLAPAV